MAPRVSLKLSMRKWVVLGLLLSCEPPRYYENYLALTAEDARVPVMRGKVVRLKGKPRG